MKVESNEKPTDTEKFLKLARDRFDQAVEAEMECRGQALEDLKFKVGEQWDETIKADRHRDKRPCLTINLLLQYLRQVGNDQRQNRPSVVIDPVDDYADPKVAEILQGLIRHIERASDADVAYDTAFDYASAMGWGFFRILTDYISPDSWDQEIKIERITNPFSVYFDPNCSKADWSDAKWAFIVEDLTPEEYRLAYPGTTLASADELSGIGDNKKDWANEEKIRVAEYFYVETQTRSLVLLEGGEIAYKDELPKEIEGPEGEMIPFEPPITQERKVQQKTVHWCKINAVEKLETRTWPGSWIPIIPVFGEETFIENKRHLSGLVRSAKGPQQMFNYWSSAGAEMVALGPKAPWLVAEGQIENYKNEWRQANVRNLAYLTYKPTDIQGRVVPPPTRNTVEPPIQAIMQSRGQAAEDIRSVMGIPPESLGVPHPESSGRAVLARQARGDTATFNFSDNMGRALRHAGRIILELIPKIYDVPRVARIIGQDDQQKTVQLINSPEQPPIQDVEMDDGAIERIYNLGVGRYDVTISAGPSFSTKRKEAMETMTVLAQSQPQLMEVAGDLMVRNMDWPGADKIAERLKTLLPPAIQALESQPDIPPQVVQQLQQLQQENQQLQEQLQSLSRDMETEKAKQDAAIERQTQVKQIEVEARERIEAMKLQADLIKTQASLENEGSMQALHAEISALRDILEQRSFGQTV